MPPVGFETMISVLERALDRAAAVIGIGGSHWELSEG
jgi:hypothetical protein